MTDRLPTALLCLAALAAAGPAAAANWQLFATASAAKISFDRDSVRVTDGYVSYRVRIEYGAPRTSRDRRHRYSSSVSELAGDCEARTTAATSITLYDENDKPVSDTGRTPEAWRKAQAGVGTDGLQARLLSHACVLARGEDPTPPVMRSAPIHKGNSGGPILDQGGQLIGIVTAKLDALAVQQRTGDLPQNISFGVRSEVAQAFVERHSATVRSADSGPKLENTEVARIGRDITVLVACRKGSEAAKQGAASGK